MAATQVIHFSFRVQLDRGTTFQTDTFRESTASPPDPRPHLLDLWEGRPDGTTLFSTAGGLYI